MGLDPVAGSAEATTNAFYRALCSGRRRRTLRFLASNDPVPLPVLATALDDDRADEPQSSVRLALYHVHVPRLVAAGLVRRTDDGELLTTTERGEAAVAFVDDW